MSISPRPVENWSTLMYWQLSTDYGHESGAMEQNISNLKSSLELRKGKKAFFEDPSYSCYWYIILQPKINF